MHYKIRRLYFQMHDKIKQNSPLFPIILFQLQTIRIQNCRKLQEKCGTLKCVTNILRTYENVGKIKQRLVLKIKGYFIKNGARL